MSKNVIPTVSFFVTFIVYSHSVFRQNSIILLPSSLTFYILHYHTLIHKALKYAVKNKYIERNPADDAERPKAEKFKGIFYNGDDLEKLFAAVKGNTLEIPVLFGAFYRLRRSEVVGLIWSAVDFQEDTITIRHTITNCYLNGKRVQISKDRTKNSSSLRTLPLVPQVKERLLALQEEQANNRKICGSCYNKEYREYICVNALGELISPGYVTDTFPKLLEKNHLKRIRFHDLRHSCASFLIANGVSMKQVQEWLGHSDFSTTANIYSHLEYKAKIASANTMAESMSKALSAIK